MQVRAVGRYVRISPQKARLVADSIRGAKISEARRILSLMRKKAAGIIEKVLKSAVANAAQNPDIDEKILYVKEIYVNQGPALKRWRARAQGRAAKIKKRMSHITVILDEG